MSNVIQCVLLVILILLVYSIWKNNTKSIPSYCPTTESYAGSYSEGELRCISHGGTCPPYYYTRL